jgi:hypothetical protein
MLIFIKGAISMPLSREEDLFIGKMVTTMLVGRSTYIIIFIKLNGTTSRSKMEFKNYANIPYKANP